MGIAFEKLQACLATPDSKQLWNWNSEMDYNSTVV